MTDTRTPPRFSFANRLKRLGLVILMALATINIWTGGPLLGVWLGSRVQGTGPASMEAIVIVLAVIVVVSLLLTKVLAVLGDAYDRVTGRTRKRHQATWLKAMSGERARDPNAEHTKMSALEVVLIGSVVLAVIAFEAWFFLFAGSSIGSG